MASAISCIYHRHINNALALCVHEVILIVIELILPHTLRGIPAFEACDALTPMSTATVKVGRAARVRTSARLSVGSLGSNPGTSIAVPGSAMWKTSAMQSLNNLCPMFFSEPLQQREWQHCESNRSCPQHPQTLSSTRCFAPNIIRMAGTRSSAFDTRSTSVLSRPHHQKSLLLTSTKSSNLHTSSGEPLSTYFSRSVRGFNASTTFVRCFWRPFACFSSPTCRRRSSSSTTPKVRATGTSSWFWEVS